MLKLFLFILFQVFNVISSANLDRNCLTKDDVFSPKFKSSYIKTWEEYEETMEISSFDTFSAHLAKVTLTCGSGIISENLIPTHELSGICHGDNILDAYNYEINYYDLKCDFSAVMKMKLIENTNQCPLPFVLLQLGFNFDISIDSTIVYEMCFNNETNKANYVHKKILFKDNDTLMQKLLADKPSNYFKPDKADEQTINKSIIIKELKSIVEINHKFEYNIKPLFEVQDVYSGVFNKSQSTYLWNLIKYNRVGYATVTLINGNSTEEYFCKTQIPNEIIAEDKKKSFDFQLCKYEDLKKTIPEMPNFEERIWFVAGTDFP